MEIDPSLICLVLTNTLIWHLDTQEPWNTLGFGMSAPNSIRVLAMIDLAHHLNELRGSEVTTVH